jgi:hypothetical protein
MVLIGLNAENLLADIRVSQNEKYGSPGSAVAKAPLEAQSVGMGAS